MFRKIPDFYLTSSAVDYMAVIFCTHFVAVKCEVFTTSTREIQLFSLLVLVLGKYSYVLGQQPANVFSHTSRFHTPVHVQKSKWKGSLNIPFSSQIHKIIHK